MSTSRKPLLCLDFDGVLHSYTSGWQGADVVSDPPVPGAMDALSAYTDAFRVAVYSSRSGQSGGLAAMSYWLHEQLVGALGYVDGSRVYALVEWPTAKPPAVVTLDDRAIMFTGRWPTLETLAAFQPWNKRDAEADRMAVLGAVSRVVHDLIGVSLDDEGAAALATDLAMLGYDIVRRA